MKSASKNILLLFAVALWFASCEQIIEIDLPEHDPVLVVNSTFTPDSTWAASVTKSQGIQVPRRPADVVDATVLILENGAVIDTLRHDQWDIYTSVRGTHPVAGHSYTLQASAPGYETVSGTDIVPMQTTPFDLAWRDSVYYDQFDGHHGEFSFKIADRPGEENFYMLNVYRVDSVFESGDTLFHFGPVRLLVQDPVLSSDDESGAILFDDATFDGTTRTLRVLIQSNDHASASILVLGLSTVSKSYYLYSKTLPAHLSNGFNPFAEPVRVHSNMTPGMGIFAGYSATFGLVP
ncbi:MAG: hypothetical protein RLZZ519_3436 [Bacteroidota bacterium]|jgi:hypothetical protein